MEKKQLLCDGNILQLTLNIVQWISQGKPRFISSSKILPMCLKLRSCLVVFAWRSLRPWPPMIPRLPRRFAPCDDQYTLFTTKLFFRFLLYAPDCIKFGHVTGLVISVAIRGSSWGMESPIGDYRTGYSRRILRSWRPVQLRNGKVVLVFSCGTYSILVGEGVGYYSTLGLWSHWSWYLMYGSKGWGEDVDWFWEFRVVVMLLGKSSTLNNTTPLLFI